MMCLLVGEIKAAYISHLLFILHICSCVLDQAGDTVGVGLVHLKSRDGMGIDKG